MAIQTRINDVYRKPENCPARGGEILVKMANDMANIEHKE